MKPVFRGLLLVLAVVLLLGIAAVIAVVTLVDPDRLRPVIVTAVQDATGRTLELAGPLELKLLPCCAVEAGGITLGNPPGFGGEPFIRARSARLSLKLWPLLTRRAVEIGAVRVTGLEASLVGRADGTNNWTFTEGPGAADAGAVDTGAGNAAADVASFDVAGIRIEDATLAYTDEADGSRYRVDDFQLETGPVQGAAPFDVTTSLKLTDLADNSGGTLGLKARASIAVDGDVTTFTLADVAASLDLKGLGGLDALRGPLKAPALSARVAKNTRLEATGVTADLEATGADLPGGVATIKATATGVRYDVDLGAGTVGGFTVAASPAGVAVELAGDGTFGARTALKGTVRIPGFSPRDALVKMGEDAPVTADPSVLGKLAGSARWALGDDALRLDGLAVVLDDSKIGGSLSRELLPDGSKAVPRTRFDLTVDRLDADRYLEPEAAAGPGAGGGKGGDADAPTEIPVETIRGLNLAGRARVGRLVFDGLPLTDLDVTLDASGGRLRLAPLAAGLHGGRLRGSLAVDATGPKARVTLEQALAGVDFGALLAGVSDVKNITGTMGLDLKGAATGATDDELLRTLDGSLGFSLANGVYKGLDVWYEIRRARYLIRRQAPPARAGAEETPIRALELTGKLADGVLRTDKFSAEIPFLRVSGDATVDLPAAKLDSRLTALVFEKPVFGDDRSLEDMVNARLPLTISGPVADPKVSVDFSKLVRDALKDDVRQRLEDKLRDKLGIPAPATAPDGDQAAPPADDPVNKFLNRLLKKKE